MFHIINILVISLFAMVSVFVVPSTIAGQEYIEIPKINEIRPLQLLVIEEKLDGMISRMSKIVKDSGAHIPMKESRTQLENIITQYTESPSVFSTNSFDALLDDLEIKITELQKITDAQREDSLTYLEQNNTSKQHMFIECLNFLVPWRMRKRFVTLFDPNIVVLVKVIKEEAIYKVYCLKKEATMVVETVKRRLRRDASLISEDVARHLIERDEMSEDVDSEREKWWAILVQSVKLLVFITILRGFAEAVNKYGLPPDFKYKITAQADREIKRLKKLRKCTKEEIENSIAIVEISLM